MKHLKLKKDDSMFVITSAGDNALHYAIKASPKRASHLFTSEKNAGLIISRYIVST